MRSIDVCQRVNVVSAVERATSCWWWERSVFEFIQRIGAEFNCSTSILKHIRRREQLSHVGQLSTVGRAQSIRNAILLDLQSLRGGSWSGRYRIRRRGPVRRSRGGSTDSDDTKLAGKLSVVQVHQNCRQNVRKLYSTTNCWSF